VSEAAPPRADRGARTDRPAHEHAARIDFWDQYRDRVPQWIATLTSLTGVVNLLVVLAPIERRGSIRDFSEWLPGALATSAAAVVAVGGLLMWGLGRGLRRHKRRAWRIALFLYLALAVAHFLNGTWILCGFSLVVAVLLVTTRKKFSAKSDPVTRRLAPMIAVWFMGVAFVWGMLLLTIGAGTDRLVDHPSIGARVKEVLYGLVGVNGGLDFESQRYEDIVHGTLGAFTVVTILLVFFVVLRSAEPAPLMSATDEARLRELLAKQGHRDSLAYFALRRDKHVVWSPSGKAAIAGKVINGVFLASGDPLGDPEAWPGAIDAYLAEVNEFGWVPAVIGCSELGATVWQREADLAAIELGDEAIVEVEDFTLDGRSMRGVRQACNRVARAGVDVSVRRACEIQRAELQELSRLADAWRGDAVERGFSMALGRMGDPSDGDQVLVVATHDGEKRGLLGFAPWGSDGLSLDVMRRDRTSDNGLNEFMIASLISQCPTMGVRRVSLNFAVFRDALERGERIGAGPVVRAWRWLLVFTSRWFQIETLYRFNVKFRPDWEPRFFMYPSTRDIPRIAVAALQGEGFIARPHRLRRWLGRS